MRWGRRIGEEILTSQKGKEIKIGKDFWAPENWKFDSNEFLFKNYLKHMQVGSCFVHLIT
jgi:hypothetical protein